MKIIPAMNNDRGLTTHRSCVLLTTDWVSAFRSLFWLQETRFSVENILNTWKNELLIPSVGILLRQSILQNIAARHPWLSGHVNPGRSSGWRSRVHRPFFWSNDPGRPMASVALLIWSAPFVSRGGWGVVLHVREGQIHLFTSHFLHLQALFTSRVFEGMGGY
jgi:hypothetical protein